ncbi:hypothetical protein BaRGS_00001912, partial [Batillaria attramentaria]
SLIKTDPVLAWHVITGPCTPYQYRLMGPGKWAGARDAILTTMDRVRFPLATRPLPKKSAETRQFLLWFLLVVVVLMIIRLFLV